MHNECAKNFAPSSMMGKNMHLAGGAGSRIRTERERLGLTQEEFGKLADVSRRTQAAYEADQNSPTIVYLEAISRSGADVWYVLTGNHAPQAVDMEAEDIRALDIWRNIAPDERNAALKMLMGLRDIRLDNGFYAAPRASAR
ncbi:XRE family transcriptional regulator [Sphingomonas cavernae]|uniref:XRE family transcriptional regulator n=2 Tax=Sphingomonas cavernae TaxID=2320861 RepID=A0A418WP53_9SPHN|nr:XRE family transcriptional regulator [Sphingomonas cavernae]